VRKTLGLLVATAALAGNVLVASPAHAWACATDEVLPPAVGKPVCVAVITVAGRVCRALPSACS
jgi:hypothetical protein